MSCALLAATLFGTAIGLTRAAFKVVFKPESTIHYYIFKPESSLRHYIRSVNNGDYGWLIPDRIVDIVPNDYMTGVVILVLILVALMALSSVLRVAHNYLSAVVCIRAGRDIRVELFKTLISVPLLTLLDEPVTERVSRVMRDTHQLMKGYVNLLGRSMGDLLSGIAALIAAIMMEPMVSIVAIALAPILGAYYWRHGRLVRRAGRRVLQQWSVVLGSIVESLQGMRVVKVHHAERFEIQRFRKVNQKYVKAEYPLRWRKSVASPAIQIIIMVGFTAVAIVAAYRIELGLSEPSQVLGALMGLLFVAQRFKPLTMVYSEVAEASAAGERLLEILALQPEQSPKDGAVELPRLREYIKFKDVSFKYPTAEKPALNNINLVIKRGTTVAFVGPNGCGKTTLLALVPRLFDPTSGYVSIDGKHLEDVALASLRDQIAVVTQETVLFRDTIAANIAYGLDLARNVGEEADIETRNKIKDAAKHAYAHDFIKNKPDAYLTDVGDRGQTLSGGERQRVAIARAILRDPAILILDEATSMIDAETESFITEALSKFCRERTSLVIAHRLSTVVDADCIVVMNEGRIVDQGTHSELLKRCDLYQQLCRTQLVSENSGSNAARIHAETKAQPSERKNAASKESVIKAMAADALSTNGDSVDDLNDLVEEI